MTTFDPPFRCRQRQPWLSLLATPILLAFAGCAGGVETTAPGQPEPAAPETAARGVPGFDTRDYPGDAVMTRWLEESPYRWVGYYLPAPCHTGSSWQGKRPVLRGMGWGLAVLFVGEQDWPASPAPAPDSAAAIGGDRVADDSVAGARCTRANLSREQGRADGAEAAAQARAEGFAEGTVVYLDVERVDSVSSRLAEYVTGWTEALDGSGYEPGLYAHARNAEPLLARMEQAASGDEVRLWVASTGGFSLRRGPTESGFPATIWQGVLDIEEEWGGTRLRIDRNVADRPHPSG